GLLGPGAGPRHGRPGRRQGREAERRPELHPVRRRRRHLPDDVQGRLAPALRAAQRLHRHVDGRAARQRHRRAGDRVGHPRAASHAGRRRAPAGDDRARPRRARPRRALRLRPAGRRAGDRPGRAGHVVRTISTEQGAWCETLFGTEPSRNRRAPVMPLLPTTIRSAPSCSAISMMPSAASPRIARGSTPTPLAALAPGASRRTPPPRPSAPPPPSSAAPPGVAPAATRAATGVYALTMVSFAPVARAISAAWITAWRAVSEPSVPTTIDENISPSSDESGERS